MAKSTDSLNKKLLQAAISATKASEIKKLVEAGADINVHNEWGLTPVMLAAQYNHCVAVLKALIELGGDIHEAEPKYRSNALTLLQTIQTIQRLLRHSFQQVQTSMQETILAKQL